MKKGDLDKLKHAYYAQVSGARRRNLAWEFTFEEWLRKWDESGHLQQRGNKRGNYCMARIGDTGPYSYDNTEIVTVERNHRERQYRLHSTPIEKQFVDSKPCPQCGYVQ